MEILRSHTRILGLVLCALLAAVVVACYLPPTQADLDTRESEADPSDEGEADVPDRVHLSLPSPIDDGSGALLPNFDLELSLSLPPYASDDAEVYVSIHYAGEEPSFGDDPVDHTEPLVYVPPAIPCSNEIEVHAYYVDDGEESEMTTRSFTVEYDTLSVSLDGDDEENVGSNTEPLLTPARAFDLVREADPGAISTIRIRTGEYVFDPELPGRFADALELIPVNGEEHQTAMLIDDLSDLEIAGSYGERFYEIETDNDGTIFDGAAEVDHVLYIDNSHRIALRNVTITGGGRGGTGTAGGGIHLRNSTEVQIGDGVTVRDNEAESGGGVYVFGGSGHLIDAGITENNATAFGGGISIEEGEDHEVHGLISGNSADNGGGVFVFGGARHLVDAEISGNNPADGGGVRGGGLSVQDGENHQIHGVISGNRAGHGGGVYVLRGNEHVIDAEITGNNSDDSGAERGGGISIEDGAGHTVHGRIDGNSSGDGGGVYLQSSDDIEIVAIVERNTATGWGGGGISVDYGQRISLGGIVQENNAVDPAGVGGGISLFDVTDYRILDDLRIHENTAEADGGGVYIDGSTYESLSEVGVEIAGNSAGQGGGIYNRIASGDSIPEGYRDAWFSEDPPNDPDDYMEEP